MPRVTIHPEPIAALRSRYCEAVAQVFDVESISLGLAVRPGELQANTFDTEDGIRLIISRDRHPEGEVVLHMSASIREGSAAYKKILACKTAVRRRAKLCELALRAFGKISGQSGVGVLSSWSPEMIPHWHFKSPVREGDVTQQTGSDRLDETEGEVPPCPPE